MQCGLLGRKLSHSYSPAIHAHLGDYDYSLFEKEPKELEAFLRRGEFDGINVTIPYKKTVMPYLDATTDMAKKLGAVNTIVRQDGKLIGHNTDYFGFHSMVRKSGVSPAGKKCLVLGSGGASNVVVAVLEELGAAVTVISRSGENNYTNLAQHSDAALIVNATPVGMYPDTGVSPVDLALFPNLKGVLDLIYNPARTKLLLDAQQRGLAAMNGLWMLVAQAKAAAQLFTGSEIPESKIAEVFATMKSQMENVILIGMPGCGKSTVGRLVAEKWGKTFVDADTEIEKMAKKTIPKIFSEDGEGAFRAMETRVLAHLSKQSNLVIATGGGCVTREENFPLLRQNGKLFWLQRDWSKLPTEGRPLSQSQRLAEMYESRAPLYRHFADCIIDNNREIEDTVNAILEGF